MITMNIDTLNIIQILIIISLFVVIFLLARQNVAMKFERRVGRYSIEPINAKFASLFDNLNKWYNNLIIKLRKPFSKSFILKELSKRYEKYVVYGENKKSIDYITNKLIIGILFIIITIFSQVLQGRVISFFEVLLYFVIGYFILDIYIFIIEKKNKKLIEDQMLRAIIIMNNAFKSGKSTLQAVEIASKELKEPINHEFEKMYKDMKYGLSVDTVFERFAKRIDIEEARYVSSSLTILNKTGGNIVKVFSSIEKTLFDKKKLKEELRNLTVSSNMIRKVLFVVPIVFIALITLLDPNYFQPLFSSPLGYMIIALIVLMFIVYVLVLRRVMKVKV